MPLPTLVDFKSRQGSHTEATGAWLKGGGGAVTVASPLSASTKSCFVLFCFVSFCFVLYCWWWLVGFCLFVCFCLLCFVLETGSDCETLANLELTM